MSKVKKFLDNYQNPNTKRNLRIAITRFFESIYEEATPENLNEIAEKYFSEKRDLEKDLQNFVKSMHAMLL